MPRRREVPKRKIIPDPKYGDRMVAKFINALMLRGKKSVAERILYGAFDIIEVRFWELFWPGVMIVAGGSLIMQTLRRHRGPSLDPSESVSSFTFMGGVKRTSNANPFRHSDLTAIWGGCDLDLRQATIPPGEEAAIDVFALMGGHKIRVPEEWAVDSRVFPFMGADWV